MKKSTVCIQLWLNQPTPEFRPAASISDIDLVSPEILADILAGKDVNFNILLIPNYTTPALKKMKEKDERLSRNLSLDEFVVAFGR